MEGPRAFAKTALHCAAPSLLRNVLRLVISNTHSAQHCATARRITFSAVFKSQQYTGPASEFASEQQTAVSKDAMRDDADNVTMHIMISLLQIDSTLQV